MGLLLATAFSGNRGGFAGEELDRVALDAEDFSWAAFLSAAGSALAWLHYLLIPGHFIFLSGYLLG